MPDATLISLIITAMNVVLVGGGLFLVYRQLRIASLAQVWALLGQTERDFDELNKLMLEDQALRDTYRRESEFLQNADDSTLRQYVFYELYYGHLARTYVFLQSEVNPRRADPYFRQYWKLYEAQLRNLLGDPLFRRLHNDEKRMKLFEPEFMAEVDRMLSEMPNNTGDFTS